MLILGIETATLSGGVALTDEKGLIVDHSWNIRIGRSEYLISIIERIFADSGLTVNALSGVAISIGPGSFTGLRIGLSTGKGLCFALGIPLVTVSTLDAIASTLPYSRYPVCVILDARKKEVYTCLYDTSSGEAVRLTEPEVVAPSVFLKRISQPTLFIGDGTTAYRDEILSILKEKAFFAPPYLICHSSAAVSTLGLRKLVVGQVADIFSVEPFYLRSSEAELLKRNE